MEEAGAAATVQLSRCCNRDLSDADGPSCLPAWQWANAAVGPGISGMSMRQAGGKPNRKLSPSDADEEAPLNVVLTRVFLES
eukprot:3831715-Rhodomonas_salina.2